MSEGRRLWPLVALAVVAGGAAAAVAVDSRESASGVRRPGATASAWRGLVGGARPEAALGRHMIVVLRAPSLAARVARAGGLATGAQERRWTAQAFAAQTALVSRLGARGLPVTVEYSFARVLDGFSAVLGPRAVALLERSPEVAGVYRVRAAYPAALSEAAGSGAPPPVPVLPGRDGRGVTVALLDTGVDRTAPQLHGHVLAGYDVLGNARTAVAQADPLDRRDVERHGTRTAEIVVGVAPGATVLPVRVAGWQPDANGRPAVFARSDQLIAGLERAVDPNDDGDSHDAARIVLVPLAEPYAAFADSPEVRALGGALRLDALPLVAAGNDGPGGPDYGSIAGPGGGAGALTVGAADLRPALDEARVAVRTGLRVELDRLVPLAGRGPSAGRVEGELAAPASPLRLFDRHGFSLVAGRIALLRAGAQPEVTAALAARAGAVGVLLYGRDVAGGAVGSGAGIPVAVVPARVAGRVVRALHAGTSGSAAIGAPRAIPRSAESRVAAFSSRGLAFDGRLKPDVVASGVSVASLTGTSASSAVAAGAAALLAQARPELGADRLRSLLVGTARGVAGPVTAQGTGLVDVAGAAAAELVAEPPSLALGRGAPGRDVRRSVVLHSLSPRPLRVFVGSELEGPAAAAVSVQTPLRHIRIAPHGSARVPLEVRVRAAPPAGSPLLGTLDVSVTGGDGIRVPFTLTFPARDPALLRDVRIGRAPPTLVSVAVGEVSRPGVPRIRAVERLDLRLATTSGRPLGVLARVRDLLPGRYVFGLTGRGPNGAVLRRGAYRLTLVATPTDGGPPTRKEADFRVK